MLWASVKIQRASTPAGANGLGIGESAKDGIYLISELADEVGLEPKTIRFYERIGLLQPSVHGRMRVYSPDDAKRLFSIKKLRQFGFSIAKIKAIRDLEGDLTFKMLPCGKVADIISAQLSELKREQQVMMDSITELESYVEHLAEAKSGSSSQAA